MQLIFAALGSKLGIGLLVCLGSLIALWVYGEKKEREGYNACKVEWDAAVQSAIQKGEDARTGAESDVAADPDGLHNDPHNRDR
jgi:hypothetical protein